MREEERNGNWFAVESKSFEIRTEGKGKKAKWFITERSRGIVSWIRFGIEGMVKLLMGVEECCRASVSAGRKFGWRENGRSFWLESKVNNAGRFLLCSVTDGERKKHWLVFPKGRGFLNGWTILAEKIREMGFKPSQEDIPMRTVTAGPSKGGGSRSKNIVTWGGKRALKDVEEGGSSRKNAVWVDVGDCGYGKEAGSLQFCMIGRWKKNPEFYPTVKELEVWFREAWRLNEGVKLAVLNEELLLLELKSPEKAKRVFESGRRSFNGGVLQLDWWSPESGCIRSKGSVQEAWIRVVGLPLHLWTTEIFRKIGDECGGFVAVDEDTELKKEVKWARLLIKMSGEVRPSAANILEGPRTYELQIWWEILPWVTGVFPASSRFVGKNTKEEVEEGARAVERVGRPCQSCNAAGQKAQGCGTRKEKGPSLIGAEMDHPVSGALLSCSGGANEGGLCEEKNKLFGASDGAIFVAYGPSHVRRKSSGDQRAGAHKTVGGQNMLGGFSESDSTGRRGRAHVKASGDGKLKQSGLYNGATFEVIGPSAEIFKSPMEYRAGELKTAAGAHKTEGGHNTLGGSSESVSTGHRGRAHVKASGDGKLKQAGLYNGANSEAIGPSADILKSPIEYRAGELKTAAGADGLEIIKSPIEYRAGEQKTATGADGPGGSAGLFSTGPVQAGHKKCLIGLEEVTSAPREEQWLEDGGSLPGEVRALVDPARICVRGPYLNVQHGNIGLGDISGFESCWEEGRGVVSHDCSSAGISHQDHGEEGGSEACSLELVEVVSECPEENEPEPLCILAKGSRLDTVPSADFTPPIFSVFGRPLLPGDASGLGEYYEYEAPGEMEPLRVLSVDGSEWGKGTDESPTGGGHPGGGLGSLREEPSKVCPDGMGYNSWEDSCLIKFSEYLGVTTVGFEEEILELLRKMEVQQQGEKRKGFPIETRCERELRKLECTINYNGKDQTRGGRDRGNFLLKLK